MQVIFEARKSASDSFKYILTLYSLGMNPKIKTKYNMFGLGAV